MPRLIPRRFLAASAVAGALVPTPAWPQDLPTDPPSTPELVPGHLDSYNEEVLCTSLDMAELEELRNQY